MSPKFELGVVGASGSAPCGMLRAPMSTNESKPPNGLSTLDRALWRFANSLSGLSDWVAPQLDPAPVSDSVALPAEDRPNVIPFRRALRDVPDSMPTMTCSVQGERMTLRGMTTSEVSILNRQGFEVTLASLARYPDLSSSSCAGSDQVADQVVKFLETWSEVQILRCVTNWAEHSVWALGESERAELKAIVNELTTEAHGTEAVLAAKQHGIDAAQTACEGGGPHGAA